VHRVSTPRGSGISSVRLERKSGPIDLVRPGDVVATLSQTGQPDRRISLPRRELPECLADELRRLDPDDAYEDALLHGIQALQPVRLTAAAAAKAGKAPDPAASRRLAARLGRDESAQEASAMITAPPAPEHAETADVHAATVRKLAGKRTPREKQAAKARKNSDATSSTPTGGETTSGTAATERAPATSGSTAKRATAKRASTGRAGAKAAATRTAATKAAAKKTATRTTAGTRKASARKSTTSTPTKATARKATGTAAGGTATS
jgi:hypothetical protein